MMSIAATRDALSHIFCQRCLWLFMVLMFLIGAVSFVPANDEGRLLLNAVNMLLLIATVAAVGRTTLSFVIAFTSCCAERSSPVQRHPAVKAIAPYGPASP
jgi:hypothetical protein